MQLEIVQKENPTRSFYIRESCLLIHDIISAITSKVYKDVIYSTVVLTLY